MARNPAAKPNPAKIADEQARCFELKLQGLSVRGIAAALKIPRSTVQNRLDAAYSELVHPLAEQAKAIELERLERLEAKADEILTGVHVTVSHGRIIYDDNGETIPDHDLVLKAIATKQRLSESRRRLMGLDAAQKVEQTVTETTPTVRVAALVRAAQAESEAAVAALKAQK